MAPRMRIRALDIRQRTPNTPARSVGEEQTSRGRYFEADCLVNDLVGDFVTITGAPVGGFKQVTKIDITDPAQMPTVGIITEKSTTTRCFVVRFGLIDVSGFPLVLTPNAKYWIGFDSRLRATVPKPLTGRSVVQLVAQALSDTEIVLIEGSLPVIIRP